MKLYILRCIFNYCLLKGQVEDQDEDDIKDLVQVAFTLTNIINYKAETMAYVILYI